jgi:hypothetical protein
VLSTITNTIRSRLPVLFGVDNKNKESRQLKKVFRAVCYEFAGPNYPVNVLNIFHNKRLIISIWNRTIGHRIIQCIFGFLVDNCVPMNTYMTQDLRENYMFTDTFITIFKMKGF